MNTRRKAAGWYLSEEALHALLEEVYESALDWASLEALAAMHARSQILTQAFEHIQQAHG